MGMKAEQWRQIILSFESKKTYNNPFLDVSIWSVFTGPSGRRIRREAYWDGGNTYRIAFAPTEIGMWSYRLEAPEETAAAAAEVTWIWSGHRICCSPAHAIDHIGLFRGSPENSG